MPRIGCAASTSNRRFTQSVHYLTGRWATNGTVGSEFTGLYFDPFDDDRAWVNIQHPDSGNDRTIEITIEGHRRDHEDKDRTWWDDDDRGFFGRR